MGFLDKAKKMAEQAQTKLDEAQQQFGSGASSGEGTAGPPVEYDQHGRPIARPADTGPSTPGVPPVGYGGEPVTAEPAAPSPIGAPGVPPVGHGDPVTAGPGAPSPVAAPGVPPTSADVPPDAPQAHPAPDAPDEDRNHPSYAPPPLSSGDPLAG